MVATRVDVATPESIRFSLELADIGSRALAYGVDGLIRFVGVSAMLIVVSAFDVELAPIWAATTVVLFLVNWFYFVAFELAWNGQTPGKRVVGLRVVRAGGYPVNGFASMVRNLLRIIDLMPFAYGFGITAAFADPMRRRIGDLAAGTLVVRDRPMSLGGVAPRPAPATAPHPAWAAAAAATRTDAPRRELVQDYLDRRALIRPEAVAQVRAAVVEAAIGPVPAGEERDALIEALAPEQQDAFLETLVADREEGPA